MPDERDAEVARILAMTDAEIIADAAAEGVDIELEAMRMRALFGLVLARFTPTHGASNAG